MIQEGGLGDYYERQDRMGRPLGDRPFESTNSVSINQLQKQAENDAECELTLGVQGMSCLGCAWLIEELARRRKGVLHAKVALDSNRLRLEWNRGEFDLCSLARQLHQFGYKVSGPAGSIGHSISPLAVRLGLTLLFSLNGLLLVAAGTAGVGGSGARQFYDLLILVCLVFTQIIGGALFMRPFWRGLPMGRLHSDALPALLSLALFFPALALPIAPSVGIAFAFAYFLLLPCLVFARWLSDVLLLKRQA